MRFFIIFLFFLPAAVLANDAMTHYEQALSKFNEGKLVEAEIAIKNSLQLNLDYLPARLLLGKVLLKRGKAQAAEKEFEQALLLQADSHAVVFSLVEVKLLLNKNEQALVLLTNSPQLQSQSKYFHLQGNIYQALSKYTQAQVAYQKAISMQASNGNANINDENAQLHTDFAHLWYSQENSNEAQKQIVKALVAEPNYIPALLLSSEIYKNNSEFSQAQNNISLALLKEPHNKQALFAQAGLFLAQDKLPEALTVALKLRELMPNDPYSKLLHSSIVAGQGNTKQARRILADIKQQLSGLDDKFSDDQQVLLLSATVNFINTSYHSAKKQFLRYLELYGENSSARKTLAIMAVREQDLTKAQFHIEKALAKNPNNVELYILAAEIYRQANLHDKQLIILQKAKQSFVDNDTVNDHYLASLLANNLFEQALTLLSKNKESSHLQNRTVLAFMQLSSGLYKQAKESTQQLLNEYPDKVEILQLAGELSLKTSEDANQAIYFFNQALVLDDRFSPALLALAGIYLQQGDLMQVEQLYQRLLTINEHDALVLQLYADLGVKQGKFLLAIKLLESLPVTNDYQTGRALLNLYIATKQPKKALALLSQLEQEYSLDQALLLSKSRVQAQLGQSEAAERSLKILFGLVYDETQKLAVLADAQLDILDVSAANKTVDRIKVLDKTKVPTLLQARLYFENKAYAKASGLIDEELKSVTRDDDISTAWLMLKVHTLIAQQDFSSAIVIVEKLFKQQSLRSQLQLLAQLYGQQQQTSSLIKLLTDWLAVTPQDEWAIAQLSALFMKQGNLQSAIQVLENYPNLANQAAFLNNLANYHSIGLFLKQQTIPANNDDKLSLNLAINYAKQAYKLAPHIAAINDTLGWLYVQKGQVDKGLSLLREAIARDVNNGEIYYHLAYALADVNNNKQAKRALSSAINLAPQHALRNVVAQKVSQ